jgi:hypothetical protein
LFVFLNCGSRCDLVDDRAVSADNAQEFADTQGLDGFFETSSKTSEGVKVGFQSSSFCCLCFDGCFITLFLFCPWLCLKFLQGDG